MGEKQVICSRCLIPFQLNLFICICDLKALFIVAYQYFMFGLRQHHLDSIFFLVQNCSDVSNSDQLPQSRLGKSGDHLFLARTWPLVRFGKLGDKYIIRGRSYHSLVMQSHSDLYTIHPRYFARRVAAVVHVPVHLLEFKNY